MNGRGHSRKKLKQPDSGILFCIYCELDKPLHLFTKDKRSSIGYRRKCRDCGAKLQRERSTRIDRRPADMKSRYGITSERFAEILEEQGGACAVCKTAEPPKSSRNATGWCIDHNHTTGRVRAILCSQCNLLIGNAREDVTILSAAINYLVRCSHVDAMSRAARTKPAAQKSDSENCPTDEYPAELESWLTGADTP